MPDNTINILGIGDIVGKPGRRIVIQKLASLKKQFNIEFVVANGENISGGSGLNPAEAQDLLNAGVDVLTGGDHIWAKKDIIPFMRNSNKVIRPANYPEESPGVGFAVYPAGSVKVGVMHLQGRIFMNTNLADCPFKHGDRIVKQLQKETPIIVLDMHAEATSEKIAIGWFLNGRVSFIFGSHTHVQTADDCILSGGTAYITDCGMTGPYKSVIGRKIENVLQKMITQVPVHFDVAEEDARLCGAIATVDTATGKATAIKRIMLFEDGTIK